MKKISYYVIAAITFLSFLSYTSASKVVVIDNSDVRFRSGPSTSTSIIASYNRGFELQLINENGGNGNGCNKPWYQASNGSQIGYVCSEFS